jgi:hypothetical protein
MGQFDGHSIGKGHTFRRQRLACLRVGEEVEMPEEQVRGVGLHGDEPRRLTLSDGSRLVLDCASRTREGGVRWKRIGWRRRDGSSELSVRDARDLAGDRFDAYVAARTRAEAGWMRAVADWYLDQARRLEAEL